uniref:Putative titin isoform x1 n=1 Tax=Lutzomyia longipalpis TaxID=7200 RepID=A0A7G3B0D8_LUTLO
MLAEPVKPTSYVLQPRGKPLYEDESNANSFGMRMLTKMGWNKDKGLGAKEDGSKDFIRIRYKNSSTGMGFQDRDTQWTEHEEKFTKLLGNLGTEEEDEGKERKCESLEEKSKKSRARVHYRKFTRGKDLSQYSEKDLANIFGRKSLKVEEQPAGDPEIDEAGMSSSFGVQTSTSRLSSADYFRQKMMSSSQEGDEGTEELEIGEKTGKLKKKKREKEAAEKTDEVNEGSPKKKRKKVKEEEDPSKLPGEEIVQEVEEESSEKISEKKKQKKKQKKNKQEAKETEETPQTVQEASEPSGTQEEISTQPEDEKEEETEATETKKSKKKRKNKNPENKEASEVVQEAENIEEFPEINSESLPVEEKQKSKRKRDKMKIKEDSGSSQIDDEASEQSWKKRKLQEVPKSESNEEEIIIINEEASGSENTSQESKKKKKRNKKVTQEASHNISGEGSSQENAEIPKEDKKKKKTPKKEECEDKPSIAAPEAKEGPQERAGYTSGEGVKFKINLRQSDIFLNLDLKQMKGSNGHCFIGYGLSEKIDLDVIEFYQDTKPAPQEASKVENDL